MLPAGLRWALSRGCAWSDASRGPSAPACLSQRGLIRNATGADLLPSEAGTCDRGPAESVPVRPLVLVCRWASPPCVLTHGGGAGGDGGVQRGSKLSFSLSKALIPLERPRPRGIITSQRPHLQMPLLGIQVSTCGFWGHKHSARNAVKEANKCQQSNKHVSRYT